MPDNIGFKYRCRFQKNNIGRFLICTLSRKNGVSSKTSRLEKMYISIDYPHRFKCQPSGRSSEQLHFIQ